LKPKGTRRRSFVNNLIGRIREKMLENVQLVSRLETHSDVNTTVCMQG